MRCPHLFFMPPVAILVLGLHAVGCGTDGGTGVDGATPIPEIVFNPALSYGTVTDIDGQVYQTIAIGTQTWMAENLNVAHYRNGDEIVNANTNALWNVVGPAYCEYPYAAPNWSTFYGKLYNGYAVLDARGLCPGGWHVPANDEWTALYQDLGGDATAVGRAIQETGTGHWLTTYGTYSGVTNASGFTGLPGGARSSSTGAEFTTQYGVGWWWTSTELLNAEDEILYWNLSGLDGAPYFKNGVSMSDSLHGYQKYMGLSVRCVMD